MCGHDQRLGKCSGRCRKCPHMIRIQKVLENPGHTPAAENSGSCWRMLEPGLVLLECVSQPTRQQHSNSCLSGRLAYEGAGSSLRLRKLGTTWSEGSGKVPECLRNLPYKTRNLEKPRSLRNRSHSAGRAQKLGASAGIL